MSAVERAAGRQQVRRVQAFQPSAVCWPVQQQTTEIRPYRSWPRLQQSPIIEEIHDNYQAIVPVQQVPVYQAPRLQEPVQHALVPVQQALVPAQQDMLVSFFHDTWQREGACGEFVGHVNNDGLAFFDDFLLGASAGCRQRGIPFRDRAHLSEVAKETFLIAVNDRQAGAWWDANLC